MENLKKFMDEKIKSEIRIAKLRAVVRNEVMQEVITAINEFNFSKDELFSATGRRKSRPRYFDPESGAVWSGRGREPLWIKGKDRSKFLFTENDDFRLMESE